MDLEQLRRDYLKGGLNREDLKENPFQQFELWMTQAIEGKLSDPTAMTLATVSVQSRPSQRIVLLKHLDENGFVFFTNYGSRKAQDISHNPFVSLHFPWHELERQVKVEGRAEKIPLTESLKYFLTRPRESQLAAWASAQSQRIDSRKALLMQFESMRAKFLKGDVPLPDFWGGFRVQPHCFEFWQGGKNRLHDRFQYSLENQIWSISRLAP